MVDNAVEDVSLPPEHEQIEALHKDSTQDEILSHFQEVTGVVQLEECLRLLDESNWDLEHAVQLTFNPVGIPDNQNIQPAVEPIAPAAVVSTNIATSSVVSQPTLRQRVITDFSNPNINHNNQNFIGPRLNTLSGPIINRNNQSVFYIIYGYFWNIVYWPIRTIWPIFSAVLRFTLQFLFAPGPPTPRQAGNEVEQYISEFNLKYGTTHPRFYHGSYKEAISHAKKHLRFLMVYIHSEDNAIAKRFAQSVICSNLLRSVVDDNLLFWSCSTKKAEGKCVAESLNNAKPPFLALLCFKDAQMRMVYKNQGLSGIENIITHLTTAIIENEPYLNRQRSARNRVSESSSSQLLMQEQDEAYHESLLRDQERIKKKKEEEDANKRIHEAEEAIKRSKEERIATRLEFRKKLKDDVRDETKADTFSLLFRLPNGDRISRKFSPRTTVKEVYEYALTCNGSPNFFTLNSNFPKHVLPFEGEEYLKTCVEVGIESSTTLFVQEIYSDEEDSEAEV